MWFCRLVVKFWLSWWLTLSTRSMCHHWYVTTNCSYIIIAAVNVVTCLLICGFNDSWFFSRDHCALCYHIVSFLMSLIWKSIWNRWYRTSYLSVLMAIGKILIGDTLLLILLCVYYGKHSLDRAGASISAVICNSCCDCKEIWLLCRKTNQLSLSTLCEFAKGQDGELAVAKEMHVEGNK